MEKMAKQWPNFGQFFGKKGRYTIVNLIFGKILVDELGQKKWKVLKWPDFVDTKSHQYMVK